MANIAEQLIRRFQERGMRFVFGVPSGSWLYYMEAMRKEGLDFVLVSNEASAGFMADVCFRLTGVPAACYGTVGARRYKLNNRRGRGTARPLFHDRPLKRASAKDDRPNCPDGDRSASAFPAPHEVDDSAHRRKGGPDNRPGVENRDLGSAGSCPYRPAGRHWLSRSHLLQPDDSRSALAPKTSLGR